MRLFAYEIATMEPIMRDLGSWVKRFGLEIWGGSRNGKCVRAQLGRGCVNFEGPPVQGANDAVWLPA